MMFKLFTVVFSCLCYVLNASCTPIIKASGVQWSEPKGTGKGNITLIIVPQNSSCSNDTDMIVAVKSDYQILSQDMQLLSLVVNETQNGKINGTKCGESLASYIQNDTAKPGETKWELNKINLTSNANYFESLGRSANAYSNSDQLLTYHNNTLKPNVFTEASNSIDVFNLLDSIVNNPSDIKRNGSNNLTNINLPITLTNNKSVNLNSNKPENSAVLSLYASSGPKENNLNSSNDPSLDSNDSFLREAFDIFDKLKQNQSYHKTNFNEVQSLRSGDPGSKTDDKPKDVKGGDLKLADEDILIKEFLPYELGKNDKSFIEGNNAVLTAPTTCVPFFIAPNNSNEATSVPSDVSRVFKLLTSNQDIHVEDNNLTTIVNEEENTTFATKTTIAASDSMAPISYGISTNPQAAKENEASNLIEMLGVQPTTDKCTSLVNHNEITTSSSGVFEEISEMISIPNNKISREVQLYVTTSNFQSGGNVANTLTTECPSIANNNLESGKENKPNKITLEPKIKCDELSTARKLTNPSKYNDDALIGNNVDLPVLLVSNGGITRGISSALNASSLEDFKLAEFIEKADHEPNFEKPAEFYETPVVLRISNKARRIDHPQSDHPQSLVLEKVKGRNEEVYKNEPSQKAFFGGSDIGKVLKMRFFGKSLILDQKPSYRSEISNNQPECDITLNILTDSADYDSTESQIVLQQGKSVPMSNKIGITNILQDTNKNQTNGFSRKTSVGTPSGSLEKVTTEPTEVTLRSNDVHSTLENVPSIPVKEKDGSSNTNRGEDNVESSQIIGMPSTVFTSAISTSSTNKAREFPLFNTATRMSNPISNEGLNNAEDLNKEHAEEISPRYTTSMSSRLHEKTTNAPRSSTALFGDNKINRTELMEHLTSSNASKYEYPTTKTVNCLKNLGAFSKEKSSTVSSESSESNRSELISIPKSIRIPANSVKEIVIQIKKNKKPAKGRNYVTNKCLENKGKLTAFDEHEGPSYLKSDISSGTPDQQIIFNNGMGKIFKFDTLSGNYNPDKNSKLISVNNYFLGGNPINPEKEVSKNHDNDPDEEYHDNDLDGIQNVLTGNDYHDNDLDGIQNVLTGNDYHYNGLDGMQNVLTDKSLPKFREIKVKQHQTSSKIT